MQLSRKNYRPLSNHFVISFSASSIVSVNYALYLPVRIVFSSVVQFADVVYADMRLLSALFMPCVKNSSLIMYICDVDVR